MSKYNGYDLSRKWFDFSFENPEKIKPVHTALYFFIIEHCNRLGWKIKFGLPTTMTMEALGIKSYNTYINTFNDLVKFGAIKIIEKSKNQYSANIIELSKFNEATNKALDKALIKHGTKRCSITSESTVSINKQRTKNKEQLNIVELSPNLEDIENLFSNELEKMRVSNPKAFTDRLNSDRFERSITMFYNWGIDNNWTRQKTKSSTIRIPIKNINSTVRNWIQRDWEKLKMKDWELAQ